MIRTSTQFVYVEGNHIEGDRILRGVGQAATIVFDGNLFLHLDFEALNRLHDLTNMLMDEIALEEFEKEMDAQRD